MHLPVDVQDIDCDFYALTGHKLYGPTGIGVLYGKRKWLSAMPPYMGGGEMIADVTTERVTYAEPPHRFEAGTPPIVQAIGLGAALEYVEKIGRGEHRRARGEPGGLRPRAPVAHQQPAHLRHGEGQGRDRLVQHGGRPRARYLDRHRPRAASRFAPGRTAPSRCSRASGRPPPAARRFALYNTREEVDRLAEALQKAQEFFA